MAKSKAKKTTKKKIKTYFMILTVDDYNWYIYQSLKSALNDASDGETIVKLTVAEKYKVSREAKKVA